MEEIYKANYLLFLILEAILSHYKEARYSVERAWPTGYILLSYLNLSP